ncbi:MAG: ATP synthase F0 subunit B [Alphaproteobacteria bacterium]|nr:ATP synthase F0 subunit B [Alphaproteobacteria bacterium]
MQEEIFYHSAEFWVGVTFVLVMALLFVPAVRTVKQLITQRIERIKGELQEAEDLKLDAQKLYAEYERKFINTDSEVAEIIENQKEIIAQNKEKKLKELDSILKQKETDATARVQQSLAQAKKEINTLISQKSLDIVTQAIKLKFTESDYKRLIDNSLNQLAELDFGNKQK